MKKLARRATHYFADRLSRKKHVSSAAKPRRSLFTPLELLDDRIVPAVINVNSTADLLTPPPGRRGRRHLCQWHAAQRVEQLHHQQHRPQWGREHRARDDRHRRRGLVGHQSHDQFRQNREQRGANGGGVDAPATFTGSLTLLADTIEHNFATVGGGVFFVATPGSTFSVENTIIAANIANTGPDAANDQIFSTNLNGQNEVPPNNSAGTGTGTLALTPDTAMITANSTFTGLGSNATAAQFQIAPAGQNGPIALDANGNNIAFTTVPAATKGVLGPQTFDVTPSFVTSLLAGNVYENILSTGLPNGEIRGQFNAAPTGAFTDLGGNLIGVGGTGGGNLGFTAPNTRTGTLANPLSPGLTLGNGQLSAVTSGTSSVVFSISPAGFIYRADANGAVKIGDGGKQLSASTDASGPQSVRRHGTAS